MRPQRPSKWKFKSEFGTQLQADASVGLDQDPKISWSGPEALNERPPRPLLVVAPLDLHGHLAAKEVPIISPINLEAAATEDLLQSEDKWQNFGRARSKTLVDHLHVPEAENAVLVASTFLNGRPRRLRPKKIPCHQKLLLLRDEK